MNKQSQNNNSFDLVKKEEDILAYWKEHQIFQKTVEKPSSKGTYIFYEGPPTANGKPGIHHVLARVFKDAIPRFKTMQGYKVPRKAGWDTHGLPVELEVEKRLGFHGKSEIEKYGIKEFNTLCKESVWGFKEEWEKLTERIAYWVDMENPYITYENDYIESLWWVFHEAWDKGLVYKGYRVVPHCPRCGTTLSSHEVAQGYKNVKEDSVYIKFSVKGQEKTYLLAWTTTPWTLPGNVALAVGADIEYVKVKQDESIYIIAKALLQKLQGAYEIVEEVKGKDLVGLEYEPVFDGLKNTIQEKAFYVTEANFVTTQDGTGIVHTAVMYGVEDYELGEKLGLPKIHTVDENGKFNELVSQWKGSFVKDIEKEIIQDLKERGHLYKVETYAHDYPFCWRCKTPLLYYAKDSWFIAMSQLRDQLIEGNEKINWIPTYIKQGRFGEWLTGVKDWAASRERYWGTPLPVWECEQCDHKKCLSSKTELPNPNMEDLHRPYIDEVIFPCEKCSGTMKRAPFVIDVWFDSGAMPYAQHHYPFERQDIIDHGDFFPADFICEAIDQTRGWFYTLLAISTFLGKGIAYKNVISLGHILDSKGKKMSKSIGNIVEPWEVINQYGSDALRLHMFTVTQPGDTKRFNIKDVAHVYRQTIMTMYNLYSFYALYAKEDTQFSDTSEHIMDKWIISVTHDTIRYVTQELEQYQIVNAARRMTDFVQDISTWYLRRSRDRFKSDNQEDKQQAINTLGWVLSTTVKLLAPFTPFVSEELFLRLHKGKESVHLESWPIFDISKMDMMVLDKMQQLRKAVEMAHAARSQAKIKVRQPIDTVVITGTTFESSLQDVLLSEVNAKHLSFEREEVKDHWIEQNAGNLSVFINPELTDELKKEGYIREIIRHTNNVRKQKKLTIADVAQKLVISCALDLLVLKALQENKEELSKATLVKEIEIVEQMQDFDEEVTLEEGTVRITLVI